MRLSITVLFRLGSKTLLGFSDVEIDLTLPRPRNVRKDPLQLPLVRSHNANKRHGPLVCEKDVSIGLLPGRLEYLDLSRDLDIVLCKSGK